MTTKKTVPDYSASPGRRDAMGLRLNDRGALMRCLETVVNILKRDPEWRGVLVYNEAERLVEKQRLPPFARRLREVGPWTDFDDTALMLWFSEKYDLRIGIGICVRAVNMVARDNPLRLVSESQATAS